MLKLEKFNNVYGIKEMKKLNNFGGNVLIYAPNGTMKTSFCEGIISLASGENPRDVFNDIDAEIVGSVNGNSFDSTSIIKFPVVSFTTELNHSTIFDSRKIAQLAMSMSLRKQYNAINKDQKQNVDEMLNIIANEITKEKRTRKLAVELLEDTYGEGKDQINTILNFEMDVELGDYEQNAFKEYDYVTIFNNKTVELFRDSNFSQDCKTYLDIVDVKIDEYIFKEGFGLDELQATIVSLDKNNYFTAGHKLLINNKEYGSQEAKNLIETTKNELYKDEATEEAFNKIKKRLVANANTRSLQEIIEKDPSIIRQLSDYKTFRKKLIKSKLISREDEIMSIKNELKIASSKIDSIIKRAANEQSTWQKVVYQYTQRFWSVGYEIEIINKEEALLGRELPIFSHVHKESNKKITDDTFVRLSTGEKRSIFVLNLMYEIALQKTKNENFMVILDDIADSFDYKNKYAILEYIAELTYDPKIQVVILTHNFDFYRSVLSSRVKLDKKIMVSNNKGNIKLNSVNDKGYENLSYIKNWKNNGNNQSCIALLPFLRNMVELKDGQQNHDYVKLSKYLHYTGPKSVIMDDLVQIFSEYNIKHPSYNHDDYHCVLKSEINLIVGKTNLDNKLMPKMLLGIYLRIFTEKYLYDKYKEINGSEPSIVHNHADDISNHIFGDYSSVLRLIEKDIDSNELKIIRTSRLIAPSFVHVNSFMYEPLIDVGHTMLVKTVKELISIL